MLCPSLVHQIIQSGLANDSPHGLDKVSFKLIANWHSTSRMIPILQGSFGYYSIFIHPDIFHVFFEKYILTCNVGTRIEVYGFSKEEGYVFLKVE
ncbi:hypothetical protein TNIN_483771 [Trichonephila inaurata madagascariensis]|uniref:Uncharacterized protein n=1 Tax=Trichonephila inaurata madagascariensis TaxID=2747483 RepID=A0A8X6WUV2_9ARAC|nr:hypothetical protein TNIN_483771 [Trichonephila inaurata madagascariensis]